MRQTKTSKKHESASYVVHVIATHAIKIKTETITLRQKIINSDNIGNGLSIESLNEEEL